MPLPALLSCLCLPIYFLPSEARTPRIDMGQLLAPRNDHTWTSGSSLDMHMKKRDGGLNYNPDGSPFLWLPEDEYSGKNFFDGFDFFHFDDPTQGQVNYVNSTTAFANGLAYVTDDDKVVMKTDNTTSLARGVFRDSVRINTKKTYTTGLFIVDLDKAPWGCAVWPAFWTTGFDWPYQGEIDVLEGVHDNEHNQISWHTTAGCQYDPASSFTGTIPTSDTGANRTNCDHDVDENSGCNVVDWSRASYGPNFDAAGGGVLAMKWDENDISIWSFFRAAVPKDVTAGSPNPSQWGPPSAMLKNTACNITQFFTQHTVVFDITLCGAWAGSSYATSGCPGTCEDRLMDPTNFGDAAWSINSLKVYRKQLIAGNFTSTSAGRTDHLGEGIMSPVRVYVLLAVMSALFAFVC